jgi:hypothetical protein
MAEATEILRSCVHLLQRLSGAVSVSLYLPAGSLGEQEILLHDGEAVALPELVNAQAAAAFHDRETRRRGVGERGARIRRRAAAWRTRPPTGGASWTASGVPAT